MNESIFKKVFNIAVPFLFGAALTFGACLLCFSGTVDAALRRASIAESESHKLNIRVTELETELIEVRKISGELARENKKLRESIEISEGISIEIGNGNIRIKEIIDAIKEQRIE